MKTPLKKHIELLELLNNSKTVTQHDLAYQRLIGFREALDSLEINQLIACDTYYANKGVDRPMCCGIFLDWQPTE